MTHTQLLDTKTKVKIKEEINQDLKHRQQRLDSMLAKLDQLLTNNTQVEDFSSFESELKDTLHQVGLAACEFFLSTRRQVPKK